MTPSAVVRFEAVDFSYRHGGARVLHDLTFSVAAGEILVLVGRSGSGKSTILKLVNRLALPGAGVVRVEGLDTRDWGGIRLRRRVGYVMQEVGLFPHMTVEQNIGLVPRLERWPAERTAGRTRELLDLIGLPAERFASRWPSELSGGQRQRVGVARALAAAPPILLMDEPFGALDPVTRVELQREFVRIQRQLGTTVILVTHDMTEAFALGHRIGVLDAGRLAACDTAGAVAQSRDPRVTVFLDTMAASSSRSA